MDLIISTALSEICSQGVSGISLTDLWPKLQHSLLSSSGLHLCDGVKSAIWNGLLNIPGLQFEAHNSTSFSSQDPLIRSFEESEKMRLKIVAAEHMRDSFVGLYDLKAADTGISPPQRRTLERLAIAGTNGITQSQLAKEFGMKGNNIFYIVRNLECRGLIVRQSTIVRTKETTIEGENGLKNSSIVNTNLIHLYRYAKHLNSQQKLEITKADTLESLANADGSTSTGDGYSGECIKDDVLVKDYLPALKAVCDKLEEADGKVLVVSDIKQALGYRRTPGHRAWRNIYNRLKEARLVEEFRAEVNKKVVSCLRLLRKFDSKNFQPKSVGGGYDDLDMDQPIKCGKRGQITDQLLELPIEHQIYDMIDAEGSKGLTVTEVCKRLGLSNKRNYSRLLNMFLRFGMHLQAESHNRSVLYRVWTPGKFNSASSTVSGDNSKDIILAEDDELAIQSVSDLVVHENSEPIIPCLDSLSSEDEFKIPNKMERQQMGSEFHQNQILICGSDPSDLVHQTRGTSHDLVTVMPTKSNIAQTEEQPPKLRSYPRYPCLSLTATSAQRERRILERLQGEKFILTVELYRWLESLEKDKPTTMARKTLNRTLSKLQQEGHCKCVQVSVPVVTNCGRSRATEVVLHESIQSVTPQLLGQIHERLRSFDMQSRGQGLARLKNEEKSVPVLNNIKRTLNSSNSDAQAVRAEAMRANGFIIAKMVRAKLLHNFLWCYLQHTSPDWDDTLSSGTHVGYDLKNPHSTCKLFVLDVAIKAMPLELFLQVVGSTQKFDDLVESCKRGLRLSDLPVQKFKSLMNTQATGRLSWIIDILYRLKLIRLVTDGHAEDANVIRHAILTHALELKPYIEEPLSTVSMSLGVSSLDLRPRIRHDFILSNKEAVDIYWKTLEYCYAAADPTAAVHAFPGSAVHEVFLYRSWASVRVMTADQRAELLKRVVRDDPKKKISFADCVKIARDLNLTLEQVLRVSYDKRQSRLDRFQRDLNPIEQHFNPTSNCMSASQKKRKKSSKASSSKRVKADTTIRESLSDIQHAEEQTLFITYSGEHGTCLQACDEEIHAKTVEETGTNEDFGVEDYDFISQCALPRLKPTRQLKYLWSEMSDRQLLIQYVRHRAALGARFYRTDWGSLPDLPAPPNTCRRRMALLNSNPNVRRAIMRLCNLLGERYAKHLDKSQEKELLKHDGSRRIVQESSSNEDFGKDFKEQQWDDFEDKNIEVALNEVLRCKQMAKLEASKRVGSRPEKEWPDTNLDAQICDSLEEHELVPSHGDEIQNQTVRRQRRSSCHRLPGKFLKLLNEGINVSRQAHESLAVANAVELLKLVFLSTSIAQEVPALLAETLRRYSEHDLFAAFNFLREKKFMVGGNGSQPFVLSQQFLHSVSSSPFPTNTGKRATKFANWLNEREKDLMEEGIHLNSDLQCGDIFHLFALVSSGEMFISPCLPDEGIGELEEQQRGLKRKIDKDDELGSSDKKFKSLLTNDGEFISRREKGFPGIKVSVNRATISRADTLQLFKSERNWESPSDLRIANPNFGSIVPIAGADDESPWKAMTNYGEHLLSTFSDKEQMGPLHPMVFKTVHSTIHEAGDQGLSMEKVSQIRAVQGESMAELVVDVLEVFGLVLKVNAYRCVQIVDASFRSKYFLTSVEGRYQNLKPAPHKESLRMVNDDNYLSLPKEYQKSAKTSMNLDGVHKVTILNLPEEVSSRPSNEEVETHNGDVRFEDYMQVEVVSLDRVNERETLDHMINGDSHSFRPILPWINGDGTNNPIVYKGLTRRVLGIVMQNPGILEDDIIHLIDVLNPQSCRKLLELMILDKHLIVRKMHQTISCGPPSILGSILGSRYKKSESTCQEHFFANPMSTALL